MFLSRKITPTISRKSIRLYRPLSTISTIPRDIEKVDVCIVGGGPSGLTTAIKLKQLDKKDKLKVVVLEKGSYIGAHSLSGMILEPRSFLELFPNMKTPPTDILTLVQEEEMKYFWNEKLGIPMPHVPGLDNKGKNYVGSQSQLVTWLGEKAEEYGVEVYPGVSVSEVVYNNRDDAIIGVATKDSGISKAGEAKDSFERGMEFHARQTVFAEGCHGSLTKKVIKKFDLRADRSPQTYGLGIKEVWQVKPEVFRKGFISHTMGYPLPNDVYGGGFQYHFGDGLVTVGLVIGLDYKNPYVSPYQEFQKMKKMPYYSKILEGGKCISYGARAINEGGLQSVPKLNFPGGVLVGCSAGFVNVPKIKGTHTAMKTGILAAEKIYEEIRELPEIEEEESLGVDTSKTNEQIINLESYEQAFKKSWVYDELYQVRNIRPSFNFSLGAYGGMVYSGLDSMLLKGRAPWTFENKETDSLKTGAASNFKPIKYYKADNKVTFDIMTSVSRTGTYHDEDEQCHLKLVNGETLQSHAEKTYPKYREVEQRFCPAGVYEYVKDDKSSVGLKFKINSQNCIHCKACDVKTPIQDIDWQVPEGGDGPKYTNT
ncbi:electron-transferring-flavoprotein dehydrogenase NDAI_0E03700 [Naumovozyma dairenensis CBS 421]|uniref:Electron transfer flavoprotein-ubiquinone oxidoreductase n=1 Tax=Naumovozyma dairenensis (strain ATCC 10597 / BCRC 20456 / CBS 421 / NBRC 0211 / NRRL Y-12639) TaxID=1071378 RepID=G0WBR7_NAUDC|nr:hypothetical protein NDAI_0E03700 [Naumovozyma dairenensis CBS 421]CCD25187.1 hypothetical protein NDAI_0E03700 [Naumovozyma dairenensis CBS 421]